MSNLLTVRQVATIIGVDEQTIRAWIRDGKLAGVKLPGGDWRIRDENLQNWLDKRTVKTRI